MSQWKFLARNLFGLSLFMAGGITVFAAIYAPIALWPAIAFAGGGCMGAGVWVSVGMVRL